MDLSLADVKQAIGAEWLGGRDNIAAHAQGWSIDTRTLAPGDVFFAIRGERFDGHAFTKTALEQGALAAVVSELSEERPLLKVADTLDALQRLSQWARRRWGKPVVAITGSAGKTRPNDIVSDL